MPTLPAELTDPTLLALLTLLVALVVYWQRTLTWTEYRQFHRVKQRILPILDRYTTLFVVSRKGGHNDAEYVATVQDTVPVVFRELVKSGGSPHLVNALKVRAHPASGEQQYSAAHVVWMHDDGTQTEAYLFPLDTDHVDVYAHHEDGVRDPRDHYETPDQQAGDTRGVVHKALFG